MSANIYNFILNIWVEKSESQSYLKPFTQKSKHKLNGNTDQYKKKI